MSLDGFSSFFRKPFGDTVHQGGLFTSIRHAFGHPFRRWCASEMMIKVLFHLDRVIQLVREFLEVMRLISVLQEDDVLIQTAHGQVKLYALLPWNRFVLVTKLDQHRCFDVPDMKNR